MDFEELQEEIYNVIEEYVGTDLENDKESIEELNSKYKFLREELINNKKKFNKIYQRSFINAMIKHEDLSTTPKYVEKQLKIQKRNYSEIMILFYLVSLNLAKNGIIDKNMLFGILSGISLLYSYKTSKEVDIINEDIEAIKQLINKPIVK